MPRGFPRNINPMNQVPKFDSHASIKNLAEAELECQRRWTDSITNQWQEGHPQFKHPGYCECLGTGYYAPFEALRVVHNLVLVDEEHRTVRRAPCTEVGCPGWVPEPDIEKAEFRALLVLARYDLARAQGVLADIGVTGIRGLALAAAEAWLKEVANA